MTRYAVLRVPTSGPPALIVPPNDFATERDARARIADVERAQLKKHHTYLDVLAYDGTLLEALAARGILY